MANSYFRFKRFTVNQDKCALKVCTDACLFGAWVANEIEEAEIKNVLDIGTGTGLLSLMLAQKTGALIDAVEVDKAAAQQASENFEASGWKDKIHTHHSSIQKFNDISTQQYNVIISNPPFFRGSLESNNKQKNLAKHTSGLSFEELAKIVSLRLSETGQFYILLPYSEFDGFVQQAMQENLFLSQQVNVQQTPNHSYFRVMGVFTRQVITEVRSDTIVIKDDNQSYSKTFIELLKDYYLYL